MGELSSKLRTAGQGGDSTGIIHWCPGCKEPHAIWTKRPQGATWTWNGDVNRPTTSPSVLCFTTHDDDGTVLPNGARRTLCHYFLKDGTIEFCGDSPHEFAGKTVPLPDWPDADH